MTNHSILFTKMHGLGNDFIVINQLQNKMTFSTHIIAELAHRHLGIGFDQLLLVEPSSQADFFCRIFNSDGTEAEQCGNGMRCIARFAHEEKIIQKNSLCIETKAGIVEVNIPDYDHIQVNMGIPRLQPEPVFFQGNDVTSLSMGNPHAIMIVPSIKNCVVNQLGPQIASLAAFPNGANVGFVEIINRQHIRLKTHERGAGETFACGSNACAAAVVGIKKGLLQSPVTIELAFGNLEISWAGKETSPVYMTGPATRLFDGRIILNS